jgi:hypothetical protein
MRLTLCWHADAGAWPEHPGTKAAVLDAEVVGPLRLLDHVETFLGLGRPDVSPVRRIAAYRRKVEAAGSGRFWSASFAVDPWSTARELLIWRDELVEAGWKPGLGGERSRLADLAAAERAGPPLPLGKSDRLRLAIAHLADAPKLPLTVELVDDRALLPLGWRDLLSALEIAGVGVDQRETLRPRPAAGDVGHLATGAGDALLSGDGSVTLLSADTEIAAAEALSAWLAASPEGNEDVVFVLGKETPVLDHALARHGLPRFGLTAPSAQRSLLQVLPLAFSLCWNPLDPSRLLDFLLLPTGPLSAYAARKLARVVAESPGVGGLGWEAAWHELIAAPPEGSDAQDHAQKVAFWRQMAEPHRHLPADGIPHGEASAIADRVAKWAGMRARVDGDELMSSLARMASDLSAAISESGMARLDRVCVERMVEEAMSNGVVDASAVREAAPWRSVRHPGALWGEAEMVVWWHFADVGETSAFSRWNEAELASLAAAGLRLDDPETSLRLLSAAWERPLRNAGSRLVFVRPTVSTGSETKAHPFWHSLSARASDIEEKVSFRAEQAFAGPVTFAGRSVARGEHPVSTVPKPRQEWLSSPGAVRPREMESASSLEAMLTCPLKWALRYGARLRSGLRRSLPGPEKLIGLLVHKVAEEIFKAGAPPLPDEVESFAARRLPELIPIMAATLHLPEFAAELSAATASIPSALAELARFLQADSHTIVGVESEFAVADALGVGFGVNGRLDLRAVTPAGRPVVIDLKWYKTDTYVRRDLKNGKAIQVSVYGRHVTAELVARVGYYMLKQGRFLTSDPDGAGTVIDGKSSGETWDDVVISFKAVVADMAVGRVRSCVQHRGRDADKYDDPYLMAPANCDRCDYNGICGEFH